MPYGMDPDCLKMVCLASVALPFILSIFYGQICVTTWKYAKSAHILERVHFLFFSFSLQVLLIALQCNDWLTAVYAIRVWCLHIESAIIKLVPIPLNFITLEGIKYDYYLGCQKWMYLRIYLVEKLFA